MDETQKVYVPSPEALERTRSQITPEDREFQRRFAEQSVQGWHQTERDYAHMHAQNTALLLRDRPVRFGNRPLRPFCREDQERGIMPGCEDRPHSDSEHMILVRNKGQGVECDILIPSTAALRALDKILSPYDELDPHNTDRSISPYHLSHAGSMSNDQKAVARLVGNIDPFDDIFSQAVSARATDMQAHYWAKHNGHLDNNRWEGKKVWEVHVHDLKFMAGWYRTIAENLARFQQENPDYAPIPVKTRESAFRREWVEQQKAKGIEAEWRDAPTGPWGKVWQNFPVNMRLRASELDSEIAELQGLTPVQLLKQLTGKEYELPHEPEQAHEHDFGR